MTDLWADLLGCLDLDGEPPAFAGRNQQLSYHRLFGGQLLAQFARAAALTCPGKAVKSLHALFPRAGQAAEPVSYEVASHHEGGAFATLTILARQAAGVIATAAVSMHAAEDGRDCQADHERPVLLGEERRVELGLIPWETRASADLDSAASGPPELDLWMRTPPVSQDLAAALVAYASDLTLIGTALRPVDGLCQRDSGTAFTSAVTSHTLWFHRPFRTDDWLLLRQHGPILAHGRSYGRGDVRTQDGALVASYAQEALLRFKP